MEWKRDAGVAELIRFFNGPQFFDESTGQGDWGALNINHIEVIKQEWQKCHDRFEYLARNYFWITTKSQEDKLFSLWEAQDLILQKIYDLKEKGLSQRLYIIKARQLGCSVLIEGLIAWKAMFYRNANCLVVSNIDTHAQYLFSIMTHFYDMMPWWLRPELASRTLRDGLIFDRKDSNLRKVDPGMNSKVMVQWATSPVGIGQGTTLAGVHLSETTDWSEDKAKETIEGDMKWALAEGPTTFGIIETTARGAGTYSHKLWKASIRLAEKADWTPVFLPWFFESSRRMSLPPNWRMDAKEEAMREKASRDWCHCLNCHHYIERYFHTDDRANTLCQECKHGELVPVILSNEQLCWMWKNRLNAEERGDEALKELKAECCLTAEEAFQLSGIAVFPEELLNYVETTVRPPVLEGFIDAHGQIHGVKDYRTRHCFQAACQADHTYDDKPLQIWELPRDGVKYCAGVDVAEGLGGESDYTVCNINRIGIRGDVQVAVWRTNTVGPYEAAKPVCQLSRLYNEALLAIEINKYDTLFTEARMRHQYPNMYRFKHVDSTNMLSNKWGWLTNGATKPRLYQTMKSWLGRQMLVLHSENVLHELKHFQKEDYEERGASSAFGFHDDEAIAAMIALYAAHEGDWDEGLNYIPAPTDRSKIENFAWRMSCNRCAHQWGSDAPHKERCPVCESEMVRGKHNTNEGLAGRNDLQYEHILQTMRQRSTADPHEAVYDSF